MVKKPKISRPQARIIGEEQVNVYAHHKIDVTLLAGRFKQRNKLPIWTNDVANWKYSRVEINVQV